MFPAAVLLALIASTPPEANRMKPEHAPTPFSADEIRKGCPNGRINTFRIEIPGKDPVLSYQRFHDCTKDVAHVERYRMTPEGKLLGKKVSRRWPWKSLQGHASHPKDKTKITEGRIETPAGKFDCWIYAVLTKTRDGKTRVTTLHFAKTLPGPPIRMIQEIDGKRGFTMTLIQLVKGAEKKQ